MNAEQPNTLQTALSELNTSIFEIGDAIPEGVYLQMMNNSKKVFDEVEKMKKGSKNMTIKDKIEYTLFIEDGIYKIDSIISGVNSNGTKFINFYGGEDGGALFSRKVGDYIRVFMNGDGYKFLRIDKINKNSIVYTVYKIILYGNMKTNENNLIIKKGDNIVLNLRSRNILLYGGEELLARQLYDNLIWYNSGTIEDKKLKIDIE